MPEKAILNKKSVHCTSCTHIHFSYCIIASLVADNKKMQTSNVTHVKHFDTAYDHIDQDFW